MKDISTDHVTKITFLGTAGAVPEIGSDTASFIINDAYLVDTGWKSVDNLRKNGIDPLQIEYLFFTHLHHDHYLSLPALLFYLLMKKRKLKDLKIVGPAQDVERVVKLAMDFLQSDQFFGECDYPAVLSLHPGETFENESFKLETCATVHPVQGLCYRFTDKNTAKVVSFTGDTAYHPPIIQHVEGSQLLIHEASLGPVSATPGHNFSLHSGAVDAANIAMEAKVEKLVLIHGAIDRSEECVQAAGRIFPKSVEWPKEGQTIIL